MRYSFCGPNTRQIEKIESVAKMDPAKAAKDYKLRKIPMGSRYWIVSKLPNMQGSDTPTVVLGSLTGEEENKFLAAIKEAKL